MKVLNFATHNLNKAKEIIELLPKDWQLRTLTDCNIHEDIPETGITLEENALLKARYLFDKLGESCFADDTGLEINALNGEPGVYSARYAGGEKSSENNMSKVLDSLKGSTDRTAQFRTVIAYISKSDVEYVFEGVVKGSISLNKKGEKGFGYDPIFIPEGKSQSFAQMQSTEKNQISHRGRAIHLFLQFLESEKN